MSKAKVPTGLSSNLAIQLKYFRQILAGGFSYIQLNL